MNSKLCTRCGERKPLSEFGQKHGVARSECKACGAAATASWRRRNTEKVEAQKVAVREKRRRLYLEDLVFRVSVKAGNRSRWHALPIEEKRRRGWNNHLRTKYGLSYDEYLALYDAQGGACAICRKEFDLSARRRFHVDHDHVTGVVRGLLCNACNTGLGLLADSPELMEMAIDYVVKARKSYEPGLLALVC